MENKISFDQLLEDCNNLASKINCSGFKPDYLVGLARGGWVPTRILSQQLGIKDILSFGTKYSDMERKNVIIYSQPNPIPSNCKILIIEDCLESGKSIQLVNKILLESGNDVKTCSIYITPQIIFIPDFYHSKLENAPRFPWE